jgi:hypothetical protein
VGGAAGLSSTARQGRAAGEPRSGALDKTASQVTLHRAVCLPTTAKVLQIASRAGWRGSSRDVGGSSAPPPTRVV